MTFTTSSVLALAPDDSSALAARSLMKPENWPTLGKTGRAVWGECKGSGSKPYRTQVDICNPSPTFKCSCPSHKFPCKHGLALLLMHADKPTLFGTQEPDWVIEWLDGRSQRAEKKEAKAAEPFDSIAAAKREQARWKKIEAGVAELDRFLADQLSHGLASLSFEHVSGWREMSARMVDAQAPALGDRLSELIDCIGGPHDWPRKVLHGLGRLHLLVEAVQRRETIPPKLQCDLRVALGWPVTTDQAVKTGDRFDGVWHVVGQMEEERAGRMIERRVWLQSADTGRYALVQDFMPGGRGFEMAWITGTAFKATLVFYPGTLPLRALLHGDAVAAHVPALATQPLLTALESAARQFGANPWIVSTPLALAQALPFQLDDGWWLQMENGESLPMRLGEEKGLVLAACSGQEPVDIFGEWDGAMLTPLTTWNEEGVIAMGTRP